METMLFSDARQKFLQAAEQGKVRALSNGADPGSTKHLSPARAKQVVRRAELALSQGTGRSPDCLEAVDVGPHLLRLADYASEIDHLATTRNVVSDCRLFVSTVLGRDVRKRAAVRQRSWMFEEAWRPLAAALEATDGYRAGGKSRRSLLPNLAFLARVAADNGVNRPEDLPTVSGDIAAWLPGNRRLKDGLVAYRKAKEALGATGLGYPVIVARRPEREWGVHTLQNLPELLAAGYAQLDAEERDQFVARVGEQPEGIEPALLSTEEQIFILAPYFGAALSEYIRVGQAQSIVRQPRYLRRTVGVVSRAVATLVRCGIDLHTLRFEDLWLSPSPDGAPAAPATRGGRYGVPSPDAADVEPPCLLQYLITRAAVHHVRGSTLALHPSIRTGKIAYFPDSAFNDVKALKYIALRVLKAYWEREKGRKGAAVTWAQLEAETSATYRYMAETNAQTAVGGRLDRAEMPYSLPHVVCILLPILAERVHAIDRELNRLSLSRKARVGSHQWLTLESRRILHLRHYAIVALIAADGLRVKNFSGAIAGVHFIPDVVRDERGCWAGFRGLRTHWWGDDCPSVRLKITTGHNRNIRERIWDIRPGIVDMDLLYRYWVEARPCLLRRAGLLRDGEELDLDAELAGTGPRYAMFVSDESVFADPRAQPRVEKVSEVYGLLREHPSTGKDCRVKAGNLTECTVRATWERAIHFLVHDVLRFPGVPSTLDECRKKGSKWRGMLGPHGDRSATAWYIGGVLHDWAMAEEWTNDRRSTLEKHYAILPKWMVSNRGTGNLLDVDLYSEILSWMLQPVEKQVSLRWDVFRKVFRAVRDTSQAEPGGGWAQVYRRTPEEVESLREALMNGRTKAPLEQKPTEERRGGRRGTYPAESKRFDAAWQARSASDAGSPVPMVPSPAPEIGGTSARG
jgi:hypothetical protein